MTQFIDNTQASEIEVLVIAHFEFSLHSQSSIREIAHVAFEETVDHLGFAPRKSFCLMIAKRALCAWQHEIIRTQRA